MKITESKIKTALRRHGYKLTPQRLSVIKAAMTSGNSLTPAELYRKLHKQHPEIGLVTVYRTLGLLDELGLLCKLHSGDCHGCTIGGPERHHHLVCSGCGKVVDFPCCDLAELEHSLARQTGFDISGHLLEFTGYCRDCKNNSDMGSAS